jgi:hypothetical protein
MCTMLGKTLTWSDEDITEYPALVDDHRIHSSSEAKSWEEVDDGLCLMQAPIAHAKLSKIVRLTLRKLYNDSQVPMEERLISVKRLETMMEKTLLKFLKPKGSGSMLIIYTR